MHLLTNFELTLLDICRFTLKRNYFVFATKTYLAFLIY